jgi:outer membrane cobalamin receptor
MYFVRNLFLASLVVTSSLITGYSQGSTGRLKGIVIDTKGAPVATARVVLFYQGKLALREARCNRFGEFKFDSLLPGDYSIAVHSEGLIQPGGAQPLRITALQEVMVVIPLTVAAIEDSMIVSATRTDSRLVDTPSSAFVISASDLMRLQQVNVFDSLRMSPGVTVIQSGRRGGVTSLFIRGGESDYTKVMIDGTPINDAGGSYDFSDLTTDNASRVELVRGAQSAIYGSDAMSGVLQFITHRGMSGTPELEFAGEGGSFGFNRQFARLSGAGGKLDYSLSFTHLRTNGRDRNDDYVNRIGTANIGYNFNQRTQLRITARNLNSALGVPGATSRFFPDPDERANRRRVATSARIDDQSTPLVHQSLTFTFAESNSLNFDPAAQDLTKPNTPADAGVAFNDFSSSFNNHQRRRGLRYQSDVVAGKGHLISGGIDYEEERAVFNNGFTGSDRVAADRRNVGLFLQDQASYGPRLFVTAGIRLEKNTARVTADFNKIVQNLGSPSYDGSAGFGTVVVPKISALYVLRFSGLQSRRGPTRIKFNWGQGIKAPTLLEAFSPSSFFLGNPALKPERARNFDIGFEQLLWRDTIRVEGVYFENRFEDQITFVGEPSTAGGPVRLPDGRLSNFINNDRAYSKGFELTTAWHPGRRLQINGSYTFIKTRLTEAADVIDYNTLLPLPNREVGLSLLRRPRHSGTFTASWIGDRFDLNLIGVFMGSRRDVDPVTFSRFDSRNRPVLAARYSKVDLGGNYRMTSRVSLFARIENLLNQNYQEVLGYPAYRLNFSAGMRLRIGGAR